MRSAGHIADSLAGLLRAELPRRVPLMRDAWNVDAGLLPDPDSVEAGELTENFGSSGIGEALVRVLTPREITPIRRVDIDPDSGQPVYEIPYSCRVQVLLQAEDWPTAIVARDYLLSACRGAIMEYPTLSLELGVDTKMAVRPETMAATYGTPTRASGTGTQCWSGGLLTCDVRSEESVAEGSSRPVGHIIGVHLDVEKIPVNAPMPERGAHR